MTKENGNTEVILTIQDQNKILQFKLKDKRKIDAKLINTHIVLGFIPPVLKWKLLWWLNREKI